MTLLLVGLYTTALYMVMQELEKAPGPIKDVHWSGLGATGGGKTTIVEGTVGQNRENARERRETVKDKYDPFDVRALAASDRSRQLTQRTALELEEAIDASPYDADLQLLKATLHRVSAESASATDPMFARSELEASRALLEQLLFQFPGVTRFRDELANVAEGYQSLAAVQCSRVPEDLATPIDDLKNADKIFRRLSGLYPGQFTGDVEIVNGMIKEAEDRWESTRDLEQAKTLLEAAVREDDQHARENLLDDAILASGAGEYFLLNELRLTAHRASRSRREDGNPYYFTAGLVARRLADRHASLPGSLSRSLSYAFYNEACSYGVMNRLEEALQSLNLAFDHGFSDFDLWLLDDPDFLSLRSKGEFERLLQTQKSRHRQEVHERAEIMMSAFQPLRFQFELPTRGGKIIKRERSTGTCGRLIPYAK